MFLLEDDLIQIERFKCDVDILLRLAYQYHKDDNTLNRSNFESHLKSLYASFVCLKQDILNE